MACERDIQREIIKWLDGQEKMGNLMYERRNNIPAPGRCMPKGSKKGSPDIFVLIQGRCVLLEVKASADKHPIIDKKTGQLKTVKRYDGKQSPDQIAYQQLSERHGGKYYVVRSLQEAQHRMAILIA